MSPIIYQKIYKKKVLNIKAFFSYKITNIVNDMQKCKKIAKK